MDKLTKIESLSQDKLQEVWVEILKNEKFSGISPLQRKVLTH